ncbi:MAG: cation transporter [Eggerthellaceae bacterium]|nr:cation transporter [Eggerthellaceae bacterium]
MSEWLLKHFVKDSDNTADPKTRGAIGKFASVTGIICNAILCVAKMIVGFLAGSVAIIADAVNNLTDAVSNIISLLGFRLANKQPNPEHPYGHGRFEYLAGLVVSALILVVGVELLISSINKIINPEPVEFSIALVIVLALAILGKLWLMAFNKKMGTHINSQTLIATSTDSRNDAISTSAVLVAALISHFGGIELDAYMGIAVALFILYSGIGLVKDTIDPLLGKAPDPELVKFIEQKALSYDGILSIHDLMVHDYGPGRLFASFHAEVAAEVPVLQSHDIIDNLEGDFRYNDHIEVTIHLDPVVTTDPRVTEMRKWVSESIKEKIDPRISIHDFRMTPGDTHTNLIFDAVLPFDSPITPNELIAQIRALVHESYPDHFCVIQVDRDYAGR